MEGSLPQHTMIQDKEVQDIWLNEETTLGDGIEYLPGWYFTDETSDFHGPFGTREEAIQMLNQYCETL